MILTFLARGSEQIKEIPRGAALELYTLQACREIFFFKGVTSLRHTEETE